MADDAIDIDVSVMGTPDAPAATTPAKEAPSAPEQSEERLPGFDEEPESKPETEAKPKEEAPAESDKPSEETPSNDKPEGEKELSPKSENRFQKLANENRELKEQLDRLKLQQSQLATEQELLNEINPETGDYYTPQEVERIAFQQSREQQQQSLQQQRYQLEIQQNQSKLVSEAVKALQDFPMFDVKSPEYRPEQAAKAEALLQDALIRDSNIPEIDPSTGRPTGRGMVINSHISPYKLYQTIAESAQSSETEAQVKAQRATEKMLAESDTPTNSPTKEAKKDSFEEGFDSV